MNLRLLTVPLLFGTLMAFPGDNPSTPSAGSKNTSTPDKQIIVILRRSTDKNKGTYMPSRPIEASLIITGSELTLSADIQGEVLEMTISESGESQNIWNGYFSDSYDMSIPFDGDEGEYQITVTSDNITYTGYFII